jgi:predicted lipid-binding transport protein (Tim44 family)
MDTGWADEYSQQTSQRTRAAPAAPLHRGPLAIIGSLAAIIGLGVMVVAVVLGIFGQLSDVLPWVLGGAALVVLGFVVTAISAILRR